jgi:hypothetical protein
MIAEGLTLPKILNEPDMPCMSNVMRWVHTHPEFAKMYDTATQVRAEVMVEEMTDISDDTSQDHLEETWNGKTYTVENKEFVQRSRLKIETRKWIASKIKPKKYGDKMQLDHEGSLTIRKTEIEMPNKLPVGAALE